MSTKVTIIDIMRAFHRWDPLDVKQLFAKEFFETFAEEYCHEFTEVLKTKDNRIKALEIQLSAYESMDKQNGVKELMERKKTIESLLNENKNLKSTNSRLYSEGLTIINGLKDKVNQLTKQLSDIRAAIHSKESQIEKLVQLIVKTSTHLNNSMKDNRKSADYNHNSLDLPQISVTDINGLNDDLISKKIDSIIASNKEYARRLIKVFVHKIISLKSQNLKLKQNFLRNHNIVCDMSEDISDKTDQQFINEAMDQISDSDRFELFIKKFEESIADKSTQTVD